MAINDQQNSQVVLQTPEQVVYEHVEKDSFDLGEAIEIAFRRRWVILIGLFVVFALGMLYTFIKRPIYASTCTILVTHDKSNSSSTDIPLLQDLSSLTAGRSVDTQVEIINSPDLLGKAYESFQLHDRLVGFGYERFQQIPASDNPVTVVAKKDTDIINITTSARTALMASKFANTIAQTYLDEDLAHNNRATTQARQFVEQQLTRAQLAYQAANAKLSDYEISKGVVAPDEQLSNLADGIATLKGSIDQASAAVDGGRAAKQKLSSEMSGLDDMVLAESTLADNPLFITAQQHLDDLVNSKSQLLQEYTSKSPEIQAVDAQINDATTHLQAIAAKVVTAKVHGRSGLKDSLRANYVTAVAEVAANDAKAKAFTHALATHTTEMKKLPMVAQGLAELMTAVDIQKNAVDELAAKDQDLMISEKSTLPDVQVITNAAPNSKPISPRISLNIVLFLLLGVLAGIGLAVLVERFDDRVHDQDVAEKITGLVTMGAIHEIVGDEAKIISVDDKKSQLVERFRVLRNNIAFSSLERTMKIMAVTSTAPSEGKSTCCTNLGIAMAMDDKRVLIVDCDLHRPHVHSLLNASRDVGFTNVLMGSAKLEDTIVPTAYDGLSFLPAGILPPNPSEVLNSNPARDLFKRLAGMYDIVILDCPPCAMLSDVQIISTIVDGVLLLVCMNRTLKRGLQFSYRALMQVSAPLMGLIVNRVDLQQHRYGYYGYYYYYGKYDYYSTYGDDTEDEKGAKSSRRPRSTRRSD